MAYVKLELGEEFRGQRVERFRTFTAMDGAWVGLQFVGADGSETNVVIVRAGLQSLIEHLQEAKAQCDEIASKPRH